jgi:hypothetical protein
MQVTVTIEDAGDSSKTILLESKKDELVRIAAGGEVRTVEGSLVERAIQNGLNVGSEPNPNFLAQTRITEPNSGAWLAVENHPQDRALVVVKVGSEIRNVDGRQFMTGVRHCLN